MKSSVVELRGGWCRSGSGRILHRASCSAWLMRQIPIEPDAGSGDGDDVLTFNKPFAIGVDDDAPQTIQ